MKKAVIYARYSCEKQTEQSIEGQLRTCYEYASRNNIQVISEYIDRAQSGTNDRRDAFKRMLLDSSKKLWDYIIVYKLDRFSRNKYEMTVHRKALRDNNIKILSATENIPDSPEGIILESLLEGMAEYYSAELSQKVKRGMRENRLKGLFSGGQVLFGYRVVDKKVEINQEEARVVVKIFQDFLSGKTLTEISNELSEKQIFNPEKPVHPNYIYKLLRNEKYIGKTTFGEETYNNIFPPIVPIELFKAVREKCKTHIYHSYDTKDAFMLKGLVKCGLCGANYISDCGTGSDRKTHRYYKCSIRKRKHKCTNIVFPKQVLEDIVHETTDKIFDKTQLNKLAEKVLEHHHKNVQINPEIEELMIKKNKIETSIKNLLEFAATHEKMPDYIEERVKTLDAQQKDLETQLAKERLCASAEITKIDVLTFIRSTLKRTPDFIYHFLIKEIVIFPDRIDITYNYVEEKLRPVETPESTNIYSGTYTFEINRGAIISPKADVTLDINAKIE